jgi:predicted nucleotidyltransferase
MADSTEKSILEQVADVLRAHDVRFIVIGGQAEALMGSPRVTYDVDLCYQRNAANLERLAAALKQMQVKLRGVPDNLPFIIDARSLALGNNFTFTTPITDLDLLGWVEPLGDYDALAKHAATIRVGSYDLHVIDLDDLIKIKQHIRRPKDQQSLMQLLAIKKVREERPSGPQ